MSTKPSLYEYYMKLIPDTVIFDEIERIAWQNNITCGTFDGSGKVDKTYIGSLDNIEYLEDNTASLFFYAESPTMLNPAKTWGSRYFFKIYTSFKTKDTKTIEHIKLCIRYSDDDKYKNILFLDKYLNEMTTEDEIRDNDFYYIIIDTDHTGSAKDSFTYIEMGQWDKTLTTTVVGVAF